MRKTVQQYLEQCRDMACHNLLCYSKTYMMDDPREGMEKEFAEATRDLEIVDELIRLVNTPPWNPNRGNCYLEELEGMTDLEVYEALEC